MLSKVQLSTGLVSFRGEKPSTEDEVKLFPEGKTPEPGTFIPHVEKDPTAEGFTKYFGRQRGDEFELRSPAPSGDRIFSKEKPPKLNKFPQIIIRKDNLNKPPEPRFPWKKLPAEQVPTFDAAAADVGGQPGMLPVSRSQMLEDIRRLKGISTGEPSILDQLATARRMGLIPTGTPRPAGQPLDLNGLRSTARNIDWAALEESLKGLKRG